MSRSASLASSSGRCWPPRRASWVSACSRVSMSTNSGSRCQNPRITATWAGPRCPARWAAAVAGSTGFKGSPVMAVAVPRSSASGMRRQASARVMRSRLASAAGSVPPSSVSLACRAELVDQSWPGRGRRRVRFEAFQQRSGVPGWSERRRTARARRIPRCAARRKLRRSLPDYSNSCANSIDAGRVDSSEMRAKGCFVASLKMRACRPRGWG